MASLKMRPLLKIAGLLFVGFFAGYLFTSSTTTMDSLEKKKEFAAQAESYEKEIELQTVLLDNRKSQIEILEGQVARKDEKIKLYEVQDATQSKLIEQLTKKIEILEN